MVPLLGLGPEGDRRARDLADLRGVPPRAKPAFVGGSTRGPAARGRLRDGPRHVLGLVVVQRPARVFGALILATLSPPHRESVHRRGRFGPPRPGDPPVDRKG